VVLRQTLPRRRKQFGSPAQADQQVSPTFRLPCPPRLPANKLGDIRTNRNNLNACENPF
jgi:hypothetical protein